MACTNLYYCCVTLIEEEILTAKKELPTLHLSPWEYQIIFQWEMESILIIMTVLSKSYSQYFSPSFL